MLHSNVPTTAPLRWAAALPPRHRLLVCDAGRHPELKKPTVVKPRLEQEHLPGFHRVDDSRSNAWKARVDFAAQLARGEAGVRLAEAAMLIVAEDDAIASHSTVAFPVDAWLGRIQRMADEVASTALPALGPQASPAAVVACVEEYLLGTQRFRLAPSGRSGLPPGCVVDHPGVWEDFRLGYLNELLVRKIKQRRPPLGWRHLAACSRSGCAAPPGPFWGALRS